MRLVAVFLLAFFVSIRSQADFYAIFDFGMPKMNGMSADGLDLYVNMLNEADSENYVRGKNINNTKANVTYFFLDYANDKKIPNHSVLVIFDPIDMPPSHKGRLLLLNSFTYSIYLSDNMIGVDLILEMRTRAFMGNYSNPNAIMAMAINFQSVGNLTNTTIYYMDTNGGIMESCVTNVAYQPSLAEADRISSELYLNNIHYLAFSRKEISRTQYEKWVQPFFDAYKAGNETLICDNCQPSRTCPEHSTFVMSTTSIRNYSCVCQGDYLPFRDKSGNSNCILLAPKGKCDVSCNDTCAEVDPFICYKRCASGYKRALIGNNFVTCTAPVPERSKSTWSYVALVFMPILAVGYIIVAIILFCVCGKPSSQAGYSSSSMEHVVVGTSPKDTKGSGVHGRGFSSEGFLESGGKESRESKTRADVRTPNMPKIEEEKVSDPRNLNEPKEKEMEHLQNISMNAIGTCKICNEDDKNLVAAFECGHKNVCKDCTSQIRKCPTCGNDTLL